MRLRSLRLRSFRAHAETHIEFSDGVTLLAGPNGAGKTNVLEAVSMLCVGRSFLSPSDVPLVRRGEAHFEVEGTFVSDRGTESRSRIAFVPGEGKRAFVNGAPVERLAELVGRVPLVVLSPADQELTAGGPSERRRLLDVTLSQAYPAYLTDLLAYRRALRQRNALLGQVRRGGALPPGTMDAWDEEVAVHGARLVARRAPFLDRFSGFVAEAHALLAEAGDPPTLRYEPSVEVSAEPVDDLRRALARTARRSRDTGRTLVGPHLDDVVFLLGGFDLRPYASQGQHRTYALVVRLAQALFLREHLDESPVMLFDDVFGPLDAERSDLLLRMLAERPIGQALVTSARMEPFRVLASAPGDHAMFHVEHGAVTPAALSSIPSFS